MVFLFSFWHLSLALHTNHKFKTLFPQSRFTKHNSNLTSQNNQQSHLKLGLKKMVTDSLVMKLMNSETHSCMVSLASLAILSLAGNAFFMILLILAISKYRSCSLTPPIEGSAHHHSRGSHPPDSLEPPPFCSPYQSLAILPLAGNAFFMILLILAIGKYRSCSLTPPDCGLCSPPLSWLPPVGLVGASAISLALPKFKT